MNTGKTRVVIAGGGTAGWLAAYSLVKRLGTQLEITLVESDLIGTVGVGEATIPTMRSFHSLMEIDEREFMAATQATFKLGIWFDNWANIGDSYIHSFGVIGQGSWMAEFHEYWLELHSQGLGGDLEDYCLEWKAAKAGTGEKARVRARASAVRICRIVFLDGGSWRMRQGMGAHALMSPEAIAIAFGGGIGRSFE